MRAAYRHVESLDAFRGVTIAGMILVNNPGTWNAVYPTLVHADWNGCTLADVVFPFFIVILGVAVPFALERRLEAGRSRRTLYRHIARRAFVLFALGLVLNAAAAWPHVGTLRIPGVLQRIAIVYLAAAVITIHAGPRSRAVIAAALLAGHWAILMLWPSASAGAPLTPDHNLASAIDLSVFGGHTLTAMGDPEGLLGTLSSTGTALLGTVAGHWLRHGASDVARLQRLAMTGATLALIGAIWSTVLPFNKPLWTGSYAAWTAGLALLIFAACYWSIDVRGARRWARPFVWLGVNPLAIYFLAELVEQAIERPWIHTAHGVTTAKTLIYWEALQPALAPTLGDAGASLVFAASTVVFWTIVAGLLDRREIRLGV